MDYLPVQLRLAERPVLLIGSGGVADAKARLLRLGGALVVQHATWPTPFAPDIRLAVVALPLAEAQIAAADLRAQGLLVNVVDQPQLCDFLIPAIIDRDPVIIAIGSGGASASLARQLRERLEAFLPATLGDLARAIAGRRKAVAAHYKSPEERRQFWDRMLAPGALLDPLGAQAADPGEVIDRALAEARVPAAQTVAIVVHSEDPDDLTLRQLRALQSADVLRVGVGVSPAIIDRARRDAQRIALDDARRDLPGVVVTVTRAGFP